MTKVIRKTYPRDMSLGILAIIFVLVFFLSGQLFEHKQSDGEVFLLRYLDEFLASLAVIIMILILWEEILFPVAIKPVDDGVMFRNHKRKLILQALIYLCIPIIVVFLFLAYEVNTFRFFAWAGVVILLPIIGKLLSGINNFNDFLTLTSNFIEYKDNELEGRYEVAEIRKIRIVKDKNEDLDRLELSLFSDEQVIIHIHQMELDDFFESIEHFIKNNYTALVDDEEKH